MTAYECEVEVRITFLVEADDPAMAKELALQQFWTDAPNEMDERNVDVYPLEDDAR